jgi:hypothetical protein
MPGGKQTTFDFDRMNRGIAYEECGRSTAGGPLSAFNASRSIDAHDRRPQHQRWGRELGLNLSNDPEASWPVGCHESGGPDPDA